MLLVVFSLALIPSTLNAQEVTPRKPACLLYDSRLKDLGDKITGMGSGVVVETINTKGDTTSQGGDSGCSAPETSTAVFLNIVVYQPESSGWARLWASGVAEPTSTASVNVTSGQLNEATGLLVATGIDGQLEMSAYISKAHYVIYLAGYTEPRETYIYKGVVLSNQSAFPARWIFTETLPLPISCEQPFLDPGDCNTDNLPQGKDFWIAGHIEDDRIVAHRITTFPGD